MKDKKTLTYILLAGSLLVWGLVFYKIFGYVGGVDAPLETTKPVTLPSVVEKEEEYTLLANYKDPFLGTIAITLTSRNTDNKTLVKNKKANTIKETEKLIDLSFISYSGIITNPATKRKVALVTVKGKQAMLSEGEAWEDVKFIKNFEDSIQISYLGKIAYVKRF